MHRGSAKYLDRWAGAKSVDPEYSSMIRVYLVCHLSSKYCKELRCLGTKKAKCGKANMGPHQVKKCLQTCAKYADSDHPAHVQSIILAFAL